MATPIFCRASPPATPGRTPATAAMRPRTTTPTAMPASLHQARRQWQRPGGECQRLVLRARQCHRADLGGQDRRRRAARQGLDLYLVQPGPGQQWRVCGYIRTVPNNCYDAARCDTAKFVADVNAAGLCGAGDWRLPTREELRSIVDYSRYDPAIDTAWFPESAVRRGIGPPRPVRQRRRCLVVDFLRRPTTATATRATAPGSVGARRTGFAY